MVLGGMLIGGIALGFPSVQPDVNQFGTAEGSDSAVAVVMPSDEKYEGPA